MNLLKGFAISNVVALLIIWLSKMYLIDDSTLVFSQFVIIPMLMGFICAWFWRQLELSNMRIVGYSMANTLVAILLSSVFLKEGVVCLIIVSPLLGSFTLTGAFIGRSIFKKNDKRINVSVVGLLLVIFITDSLANHHYENVVSDTFVINAPVNKVWKYVVAYEKIKEPASFWMFRVGLPSPVQSTVDGYKLGAGRKCIFSNGYVFDEKIVVFEPNRNITFDITNQPKDPEIMGHINILRGQFILKPNANGTTTLIGNSWYGLHVFPTWYYDIWARSVVRNVHLRVMDQIKKLSEQSNSVSVSN